MENVICCLLHFVSQNIGSYLKDLDLYPLIELKAGKIKKSITE